MGGNMFFMKILVGITIVISLLFLAGFGGRLWWGFDIFANFQLQYAVFFALMCLIFLKKGSYVASVYAAAFFLGTAVLLFPAFKSESSADTGGSRQFRILSYNIQHSGIKISELTPYIKETKPDIVVLIEVYDDYVPRMKKALGDEYPVARYFRGESMGGSLAIFSRTQPVSIESKIFFQSRPFARVEYNVDGRPLVVYGIHPPHVFTAQADWKGQTDEFAEALRMERQATVVVGDFNMTPWSQNFRKITKVSNFRDSREGLGLGLSWPTTLPWYLRIPIDHALVTPDVHVAKRVMGPNFDSDHSPLLVDILF
jgi:endonuclease/exonuclease/phosphatase (EEP) superfamily protein YafD